MDPISASLTDDEQSDDRIDDQVDQGSDRTYSPAMRELSAWRSAVPGHPAGAG